MSLGSPFPTAPEEREKPTPEPTSSLSQVVVGAVTPPAVGEGTDLAVSEPGAFPPPPYSAVPQGNLVQDYLDTTRYVGPEAFRDEAMARILRRLFR